MNRVRAKKTANIYSSTSKQAKSFFFFFTVGLSTQDFDSPCLKNKKHWNSFTAPFFVHAAALLAQLEQGASAALAAGGRRHAPPVLMPVLLPALGASPQP
jgi:hypothetical protein